MILLDTNVVSELMRPAPDPSVVAWLAGQESASLALSVLKSISQWRSPFL